MSHSALKLIAIDYSSSNEADENNIIEDSENEECNNFYAMGRRRSKRAHNPKSSSRVLNATKRMKGQNYLGFSKSEGMFKQNSPKSMKKIGPMCSSAYCKKVSTRHCQKFDEERRTNIFKMFWDLNWESKKVFVNNNLSQIPIKRTRVIDSKKQNSFIYKLPHKHGSLQVCRSMFLSTLSIKQAMVKGWFNSNYKYKESVSLTTNKQSNVACKSSNCKIHLKEYFEKLDKVESHYCRKTTKKIYIAATFKTKADTYRDYVKYCAEKQVPTVSSFTFAKYFDDQNYALYMPRKDQCDLCVSYNAKQITVEEYNIHILNKQRAQDEKNIDKVAAVEEKCHVFTMDVQGVKLCPNINASAIYFKQRLQVHNFTLYNLATHQCTNYWWNEANGDLSASTFVSIIVHHLKIHCLSDNLPIIIYSDGCGYQNRNHILSNALSILAIENNKIIEQKYLEKGHTQMECDSAHAKIELKLKNQSIYLPIDYVKITEQARRTVKINNIVINKPFDAMYLNYDFFKNYNDEKLIRFKSIRPGQTKHDPTVAQLRSLKYLPNGEVKFKVNFDAEYENLPNRIRQYTEHREPKPLYYKQLPIQQSKWKHLQDLKPVIPSEYHYFYDNIVQMI